MLLREFITQDNYGFWISPEGKIHPVQQFQGHDDVREQLKPRMSYIQFKDAGWIRIVAASRHQTYWNLDFRRLTGAAVSAIAQTITQQSAPVYIDYRADRKLHVFKAPNTKIAIAILRAIRADRLDAPELDRFRNGG